MAKQLLVVNAATDLKTYRAGAAIAYTALAATGEKEIQFSSLGQTTALLDAGEVKSVVKQAYAAGTAQVSTVTLPASFPAGETDFFVKIIVTTPGTKDLPEKTVSATTAVGIRDAINAQGLRADSVLYGFTATVSGQAVTITAPLNNHFRMAASVGSTFAYTTKYSPTIGSAAKVAELEDECLPYSGVTNKIWYPVVKPVSAVTAGATYDVLSMEALTVAKSKDGSGTKVEDHKIYVALNTAILQADRDAILAALNKLK